jgi:hypothetical protein
MEYGDTCGGEVVVGGGLDVDAGSYTCGGGGLDVDACSYTCGGKHEDQWMVQSFHV